MEPNRFKEFFCVLSGHDWTERGSRKDAETGIILSHYKQCARCGLRLVNESGFLELYKLQRQKSAL